MSALKHGFSAEVVERDENDRATVWLGRCGKHDSFIGESYEAIEDRWRQHVHAATGTVPRAMGDQENRWQPEQVTA